LDPRPHVIILNGVGSVGKSATARALQAITARPFLHVAIDTFLDMLPPALFGQPEGLVLETVHDQGKPSIVVRPGRRAGAARHAPRGRRHGRAGQ